ncbi:unnamed protein product [Closterium sp. NIES-53]
MTTLRVLLHVAAQRDYKLHSLDFSTAFLQGSLHEEIWLRRPPGFTETTLAALGFAPSTADPSLFLRTDTSQPPFYVLVYVLQRFGFQFSSPQPTPLSTSHSLSAPPSDESVEPSGPYPELVGCLMYLMTLPAHLAATVSRFASMLFAPEGDPDAPDIPTPRSYAEAITGPYSSQCLRRLVYSLRQAPREWHDTLRTTHAALGFAPSIADPSLFLRTDTSLPPFYVLVYVNDLVFATADTEAQTLVKSELQKRHTCTDLGELHSYLGLQITQSSCPHRSRRRFLVRLNAIIMKRAMAAGADVYAVEIREAEAVDKLSDLHKLHADVPDDLAALLKHYSEIFSDNLPEGLPLQR